MAMHGEFHIFSNFVNGFDWRIETTSRLQIVAITFHLLHWFLVVPIMQMIGTTFHHLLDRQKHTCRPSRQHRSEGIQATAGQRFAGSSRTRPTQPSPGGFCGLRIKEQCVNVNCPGHQSVKNTLPILTKTAKTTNTANQPKQKYLAAIGEEPRIPAVHHVHL